MEINFILSGIKEAAGKFISEVSGKYLVFLFDGEMGAGKTTFIRELCQLYDVAGNVSSPTFSIINQYNTSTNRIIYHLDLYRLKDDEEAIRAGVEECLYSGEICFVEWPFKAPLILPAGSALVKITALPGGERKLSVQAADIG